MKTKTSEKKQGIKQANQTIKQAVYDRACVKEFDRPQKIVLAYSGGLDTTYCLSRFVKEGYEVHAVIVNTGGFSKSEVKSILEKAKTAGATESLAIDACISYYEESVKYLLAGNVLKNHSYPLSVSSERAFQATAIAHYANKIEADFIAHGSTGAGNDQFRFDMVFSSLCPNSEILTPIRDHALSRNEEIDYLKNQGLDLSWEHSEYSVNQGLWGSSVGGKETLTSNNPLPEKAWPIPLDRSLSPQTISIEFEGGQPSRLNQQSFSHPTLLIKYLTSIAAPYGVGRDIHVGDTIIGIKGRVGFQAPAAKILIEAHRTLEKHVLTKHQIKQKDQISANLGELIHEGQFMDPTLDDIKAYLDSTQKRVTGTVTVEVYIRGFDILGIESPFDLMDQSLAKYGETNDGWTGIEARHYGKLLATPAKIYFQKKGFSKAKNTRMPEPTDHTYSTTHLVASPSPVQLEYLTSSHIGQHSKETKLEIGAPHDQQ